MNTSIETLNISMPTSQSQPPIQTTVYSVLSPSPYPDLSLATNRKANILILDNFPILAKGIAHILHIEQRFHVYIAAQGMELEAISEITPDALILNVTRPKQLGLLQSIATQWPKLPVLAHAMDDDLTRAEYAIFAGAKGYVAKDELTTNLSSALRDLLQGKLFVPKNIEQKLINAGIKGKPVKPESLLIPEELLIFQFIGQGRSVEQIARILGVDINAIHRLRDRMRNKLHLTTADDLKKAAILWVSQHSLEDKADLFFKTGEKR